MAGLERRLAEAALLTLDEVVAHADRSPIERDGAILRLIYTFEAAWKAWSATVGRARRHRNGVAQRHNPRRAAAGLAVGRGCPGRNRRWPRP